MKAKASLILICLLGCIAIVYGMVNGNNGIFIVGVIILAGVYLIIRNRIKAAILKESGFWDKEPEK